MGGFLPEVPNPFGQGADLLLTEPFAAFLAHYRFSIQKFFDELIKMKKRKQKRSPRLSSSCKHRYIPLALKL